MSGADSASDVSSDGDIAHFYRPGELQVKYQWFSFERLMFLFHIWTVTVLPASETGSIESMFCDIFLQFYSEELN